MGQFNGFTCDSCGHVMTADERTRVTVRYEGDVIEGEYHVDKCPECVSVPEGTTLKPLRRRRTYVPAQHGVIA